MTDVQITDQAEQPAAVVRETVRSDQMTEFFGRAYTAIMAALAEQGVQPAGMPFAKYYGMPADTIDVEAGIPAFGFASTAAVQSHPLPAGRCYEAMHFGPYDTLVETYNVILAKMTEDGASPADDMWEYYLTDPEEEPDPAKWQTRVVVPVRG